jgi:hypothetical protein
MTQSYVYQEYDDADFEFSLLLGLEEPHELVQIDKFSTLQDKKIILTDEYVYDNNKLFDTLIDVYDRESKTFLPNNVQIWFHNYYLDGIMQPLLAIVGNAPLKLQLKYLEKANDRLQFVDDETRQSYSYVHEYYSPTGQRITFNRTYISGLQVMMEYIKKRQQMLDAVMSRLRQDACVRRIQRFWRKCISDPNNSICVRRLHHEFNGLPVV